MKTHSLLKCFVLAAFALSFSGTAMSQESNTGQVQVFDVVEKMPEFAGAEVIVTDPATKVKKTVKIEGGTAGLMKYLAYTVKYPIEAEECGIQGRVLCTFVVGKDGSISNVTVAKPVNPHLDKEAVRVLSAMPKWTPGSQKGKPVAVRYTVPVTFRLK